MSRRVVAVVLLAAVLAAVTACGALRPRVYTCATDTLPPVATDPIMCHNGYPAVRWFSAYEGTPLAAPGLPLDYGWWHGGTGTVGYGRGYDPRPAGSYYCDYRCAPPAPPRQQYAAEPPGAASVSTATAAQPKSKAQADPPRPTTKANLPTTKAPKR